MVRRLVDGIAAARGDYIRSKCSGYIAIDEKILLHLCVVVAAVMSAVSERWKALTMKAQ